MVRVGDEEVEGLDAVGADGELAGGIGAQKLGAGGDHPPVAPGGARVVAGHGVGRGFDDPVDEHDLTEREHQRAGKVEALGIRLPPALPHDRVAHHRSRGRDRGVDQKHPAPAEGFGDDAAQQHSSRAAETVHRGPDADRAVPLWTRRERRCDDRQGASRHQGACKPLHRAIS